MPPRPLPKLYQLLLKTRRLTIFLTAAQDASIASLKVDALSALTSRVTEAEDIPRVQSVDDFEICREVKEKGKPPTGIYEIIQVRDTVRNALSPWEAIFVRFKDDSGKLLPVEVSLPSLLGDEEEEQDSRARNRPADLPPPNQVEPSVNKGKRKAHPE